MTTSTRRPTARLALLNESWPGRGWRARGAHSFRRRGGDEKNQKLLDRVNASGALHLTHTRLDGRMTLRMCVGQTYSEMKHVEAAWQHIQAAAEE